MRNSFQAIGWVLLMGVVAYGCGDAALEPFAESESALSADIVADSTTGTDESYFCPIGEFATDPSEADEALIEAARPSDRIEVTLNVRDLGRQLALDVRFYNPYRCHWTGDLFLEREGPGGHVFHIARGYNWTIRGGTSVAGTVIIRRPDEDATSLSADNRHLFSAKAYQWNGGARERYFNCRVSADSLSNECPRPADLEGELLYADEVDEATLEEVRGSDDGIDAGDDELRDCDEWVQARPPIRAGLRFFTSERFVDVVGMWQNVTRRDWAGDLYIDVITPSNYLYVLRRDEKVEIPAGVGFCSLDRHARPNRPGVYLVTARALHRDGGDVEAWVPRRPLTTEIIGVCNRVLCELIEPDQERARILLTGPSEIHLESDLFSEFTSVTLEYGEREIDITRRCKIEQNPTGTGKNHIVVSFNTFDLPIGPRTWANYTIRLNPMPLLPPDSKISDSLWIRTNGPELIERVRDADFALAPRR